MVSDPYCQLYGRTVALTAKTGAFRPCPHCGATTATIERARAPHLAQLICTGCGKRLAWISRASLDSLLAQAGLPVPTDPPPVLVREARHG
ncbi:MAG: hypothetical protein AAGI34_18370 [Pseudomonadota bacterium]